MSLGIIKETNYLNIKEGRIVTKDKEGKEHLYDYVEGDLQRIYQKEREFKGEKVKYWYIELAGDKPELYYELALPYRSGTALSIFNCLASAEKLQRVKISPYQSKGYTKVVVTNNGEKLSWKYPQLPAIELVKVGDREVKDDSKRMKFLEEIVNTINTVNTVR